MQLLGPRGAAVAAFLDEVRTGLVHSRGQFRSKRQASRDIS